MNILTLNAGSSSIKFALYDTTTERALFTGAITHIGDPESAISITTETTSEEMVSAPNFESAIHIALQAIARAAGDTDIDAIAHRIVYGVGFEKHIRIDPACITTLRLSVDYDPEHLPQALSLIEACMSLDEAMPQVACFDTVFHQTLPMHARLTSLPRTFYDVGARRYGFHGLSYDFLIHTLAEQAPNVAQGRVVMAHLGSGSSLAALQNKQSVETSMGFSPSGGIPMATRSGDIDPALLLLMADEGLSIDNMQDVLTKKSGLLGVSGSSPHMRTLLQTEATDERAAEAIELFVHSVRKHIGAYAAILGGMDALVFSGGIGQNSPPIRSRICETLSHLGVHLDAGRNSHNEMLISSEGALPVYVIPTNEELMMARIARDILKG